MGDNLHEPMNVTDIIAATANRPGAPVSWWPTAKSPECGSVTRSNVQRRNDNQSVQKPW